MEIDEMGITVKGAEKLSPLVDAIADRMNGMQDVLASLSDKEIKGEERDDYTAQLEGDTTELLAEWKELRTALARLKMAEPEPKQRPFSCPLHDAPECGLNAKPDARQHPSEQEGWKLTDEEEAAYRLEHPDE